MVASLLSTMSEINISILRTFRVLRPLRTLSRIKSMKPLLLSEPPPPPPPSLRPYPRRPFRRVRDKPTAKGTECHDSDGVGNRKPEVSLMCRWRCLVLALPRWTVCESHSDPEELFAGLIARIE